MPEDNKSNRWKFVFNLERILILGFSIHRRSHANRYVFEQMDEYDKRHGRKHKTR